MGYISYDYSTHNDFLLCVFHTSTVLHFHFFVIITNSSEQDTCLWVKAFTHIYCSMNVKGSSFSVVDETKPTTTKNTAHDNLSTFGIRIVSFYLEITISMKPWSIYIYSVKIFHCLHWQIAFFLIFLLLFVFDWLFFVLFWERRPK